MTNDPLYTLKEAATYLGRPIHALRHHIYTSRRLAPDSKDGKYLLFRRSTLDAFATRQQKSGIGKTKPSNTTEVARHFGVNVDTVHKWRKEGYFPNAVQQGRYWYIPLEDVEAFGRVSAWRPFNSATVKITIYKEKSDG